MIRVSAGVILRGDGRILICRRGEGRKNAHLWEFPGGKQEKGETAAGCLIRELREELALDVTDVRTLCTGEADGIVFDFLRCTALNEPTPTEHEAVQWVEPREMLHRVFCPADTSVARRIALTHPALNAVLWDFDGTLIDTYPMMDRHMRAILTGKGIDADLEEIAGLMKVSLPCCADVMAARYGIDSQEVQRVFRSMSPLPGELKPLPGIPELLEQLSRAGFRHYLVTHRDDSAWDILKECGLDGCFSGGITSKEQLRRKPAPDMVLAALERYGIDPKQAVMIGDRPLDTEAGMRAGVLSGLLDPEQAFPSGPCEFRFSSVQEIAEFLLPEPIDL